jgi:hypothetical protein
VLLDIGSFFRIAHIITSMINAPYAEELQSGTPHRIVIDILTIAPLVTICVHRGLSPSAGTRRDGQLFVLLLSAGIIRCCPRKTFA